MKITKKWLQKLNACSDGVEWFEEQATTDPVELIKYAIKSDNGDILNYANWGIIKYFKNKRKYLVRYALYAAKQVLYVFEDKHPDDKRPRQAIRAAEKWLKYPTKKNRDAAYAVADAAYDAATRADYHAARAACAAARAADYAAVRTTDAVTYAVNYAVTDAGARKETKIKVLKYGIKLIKDDRR